jgi:hypothetical protein
MLRLCLATLMLLPACLGWVPTTPWTNTINRLADSRRCVNRNSFYRKAVTVPVMQASFGRWSESDVARKKSAVVQAAETTNVKVQLGSFVKAIKKPKGTICEQEYSVLWHRVGLYHWNRTDSLDSSLFRTSYAATALNFCLQSRRTIIECPTLLEKSPTRVHAAIAAELKRKDPAEEKMPEMGTIEEVSQGLQDAKVCCSRVKKNAASTHACRSERKIAAKSQLRKACQEESRYGVAIQSVHSASSRPCHV